MPAGGPRRPAPLAAIVRSTPNAALAAALAEHPGTPRAIAWPTRDGGWRVTIAGKGRPAEMLVADATDTVVPAPLSDRDRPSLAGTMRRWHEGEGMGPVWQAVIVLAGLAPTPDSRSPCMLEPESFVLENARVVLADRVVDRGWVAVSNGRIAETGEGDAPERGYDCAGDTLLPGLVELHTDHLESHYAPRPHVRWHARSAVSAYDAQIAASGITTVFDSLRCGSDADATQVGADLMALAEALDGARAGGMLRVDHRTHLRCEIASPDVVGQVEDFAARYPVDLMSLMDHTPGQRQFRDLETWRRFYMRRTPLSEPEIEAFIKQRLDLHERFAADHRRQLVAIAGQAGAVLASHDDATAQHVAESVEDGVRVAEFPTTVEAAAASHAAGVKVMMGAPNVVRGGSHSGNVAAELLAQEGLLDVLSSDYIPASLLFSAFHLPRRVASIDLAQAIGMVSAAPALAAGLSDRGVIEAGKRADLVRVNVDGDAPIVRRVWSQGRLAA